MWGEHLPACLLKDLMCLGLMECQERTIIFKTPRPQVTSHLGLLQSTLSHRRVPSVKMVISYGLSHKHAHKSPCSDFSERNFSFYLLSVSNVMCTHVEIEMSKDRYAKYCSFSVYSQRFLGRKTEDYTENYGSARSTSVLRRGLLI